MYHNTLHYHIACTYQNFIHRRPGFVSVVIQVMQRLYHQPIQEVLHVFLVLIVNDIDHVQLLAHHDTSFA